MVGGVTDFFVWWYGAGFRLAILKLEAIIHNTLNQFSLGLLLRTLFAPWKKDEQSLAGLSFQQRFQIWLANLISRGIGLVVRSAVISVGVSLVIIEVVGGGLYLLAWLTLPLIIVWLLVNDVLFLL